MRATTSTTEKKSETVEKIPSCAGDAKTHPLSMLIDGLTTIDDDEMTFAPCYSCIL